MRDVIDFVLSTRVPALPEPVIHDVARALVDSLDIGMSTIQTRLSQIIQSPAPQLFGGTSAETSPRGKTVSVVGAALAGPRIEGRLNAVDLD